MTCGNLGVKHYNVMNIILKGGCMCTPLHTGLTSGASVVSIGERNSHMSICNLEES